MWSGTFHSIGNRLLREYAHVLGLDPSFSVIDRGDSADLIDLKRTELGFAKQAKRFPRKDTCIAIYSHRVNTRCTLAESLETHYPWCAEWCDELTKLFRGYVQAKQEQQLLDYDDLLLYWHLLAQEPSVAAHLGERFEHILVDEYQDTNTLQAEILLAMKPDGAGSVSSATTRRRSIRSGRPRSRTSSTSRRVLRRRRRSSRSTATTARCSRSSMPRTY